LVEVKQLHIGPLSLRSKVMKELRQLKDLRFENVNTFIGIYIDQNAPALIFDYGQRGSLEDILKKEEIKLDWNFKWSMLNDLVRVYIYHFNFFVIKQTKFHFLGYALFNQFSDTMSWKFKIKKLCC